MLDRIILEPKETICLVGWYPIYKSRCIVWGAARHCHGPLLFLAFINDLPESTSHSDARLFADDCLLYRHVTSSQDQALLQEDLSALERWEETWQMKLHPDKCTVIRISTNKKQILRTNYHIHGHTLEVVDSSKYLGVTISEDLTWKKHIDNTVNKANKTLGFIRRNLGDCTAPVKAAAYSTVVRPVLEYSSTVWDPHQTSDCYDIKPVRKEEGKSYWKIPLCDDDATREK